VNFPDTLAQAAWDASIVGRYTNPDLNGGFGLTLTVTDPEGTTREAYISNYHAPILAEVLAAVNEAVPVEVRSAYVSAELPLLPTRSSIVSGIVDPVYFAADIERINREASNLGQVLAKLRRAQGDARQEPEKAAEAQRIIDSVTGWAEAQSLAMDRLRGDDLPAAYALAQRTSELLGRDAMSRPFDRFVSEVRANRRVLREVESELALREAQAMAVSIGLGSDVEDVRWDERSRIVARELGERMDTIATVYRGTDAAIEARETVARWREQVRRIEARQPAWEYTWHLDFIPLGTEERTQIRTDSNGRLVTEIDSRIVFETRKVILHGTFQNTSSAPHRYTFIVGVIGSNADNDPFATGDTDQMLGHERVQTPVLAPGELYEWTAEVGLRNIRQIRRGGLGQVTADQPGVEAPAPAAPNPPGRDERRQGLLAE